MQETKATALQVEAVAALLSSWRRCVTRTPGPRSLKQLMVICWSDILERHSLGHHH